MRKHWFPVTLWVLAAALVFEVFYLYAPGFLKPDQEFMIRKAEFLESFGEVSFNISDGENEHSMYVSVDSITVLVRTDKRDYTTVLGKNKISPFGYRFQSAVVLVPDDYDWARWYDWVNKCLIDGQQYRQELKKPKRVVPRDDSI
ncbi:MAG: hypothetical protein AAB646_02520 [Patescibacteria group bacterium]